MTWRTQIMILSWEAQILFCDWYLVLLCESVQQITLKYDSTAEMRHRFLLLPLSFGNPFYTLMKNHVLFYQNTYMFKLVMSLHLL